MQAIEQLREEVGKVRQGLEDQFTAEKNRLVQAKLGELGICSAEGSISSAGNMKAETALLLIFGERALEEDIYEPFSAFVHTYEERKERGVLTPLVMVTSKISEVEGIRRSLESTYVAALEDDEPLFNVSKTTCRQSDVTSELPPGLEKGIVVDISLRTRGVRSGSENVFYGQPHFQAPADLRNSLLIPLFSGSFKQDGSVYHEEPYLTGADYSIGWEDITLTVERLWERHSINRAEPGGCAQMIVALAGQLCLVGFDAELIATKAPNLAERIQESAALLEM